MTMKENTEKFRAWAKKVEKHTPPEISFLTEGILLNRSVIDILNGKLESIDNSVKRLKESVDKLVDRVTSRF